MKDKDKDDDDTGGGASGSNGNNNGNAGGEDNEHVDDNAANEDAQSDDNNQQNDNSATQYTQFNDETADDLDDDLADGCDDAYDADFEDTPHPGIHNPPPKNSPIRTRSTNAITGYFAPVPDQAPRVPRKKKQDKKPTTTQQTFYDTCPQYVSRVPKNTRVSNTKAKDSEKPKIQTNLPTYAACYFGNASQQHMQEQMDRQKRVYEGKMRKMEQKLQRSNREIHNLKRKVTRAQQQKADSAKPVSQFDALLEVCTKTRDVLRAQHSSRSQSFHAGDKVYDNDKEEEAAAKLLQNVQKYRPQVWAVWRSIMGRQAAADANNQIYDLKKDPRYQCKEKWHRLNARVSLKRQQLLNNRHRDRKMELNEAAEMIGKMGDKWSTDDGFIGNNMGIGRYWEDQGWTWFWDQYPELNALLDKDMCVYGDFGCCYGAFLEAFVTAESYQGHVEWHVADATRNMVSDVLLGIDGTILPYVLNKYRSTAAIIAQPLYLFKKGLQQYVHKYTLHTA